MTVTKKSSLRAGGTTMPAYVLAPYEARSLTRRLRSVGYVAQVARVPTTAFVLISDEELDALVVAADNVPGSTR
ncbi:MULTISPECIES: hypothetical protein [Streptomyces]|uniref:hypothetical protein n=1 Tax=Streptomyces TaxID=1883 RepID=UPI0033F2CFD8